MYHCLSAICDFKSVFRGPLNIVRDITIIGLVQPVHGLLKYYDLNSSCYVDLAASVACRRQGIAKVLFDVMP